MFILSHFKNRVLQIGILVVNILKQGESPVLLSLFESLIPTDLKLQNYLILFYPITLEGRRGTTDEFAAIPFHLDRFSASLVTELTLSKKISFM